MGRPRQHFQAAVRTAPAELTAAGARVFMTMDELPDLVSALAR